MQLFFNKDKYSPSQYLDFVTNFSKKREIDYIFYFAPFVFSDNQEIIYDISKGFIFKSKQNIESLEKMVEYNAKFIEIIKEDPIIRVNKLKKLITTGTKSYVYYNLALSYAHIFDFHNAYKYFEKAYKLNPGNKLYSVMTLIAAQRIDKKVPDIEYIKNNIKSNQGLYKYFGQSLYALFLDASAKVKEEPLYYEDTIFYTAIDFLKKRKDKEVTLNHPLFEEYYKDPFVYLMKLVKREESQSDFEYFSKLQDSVPLYINDNFLEGPLVVTRYYIDILKSIGLFYKANLEIKTRKSPSFLRTKALKELYIGNSTETLDIIAKLQEKYDLEDKYTMYLQVAALLDQEKYNEASIQISLIKAVLNDHDADFLTGVQLIQDLKLSSAKQYFKSKYLDSMIDIKLKGLDEFLESL